MSSKFGPVLLLEDDADDHDFLQEAFAALNRKNKLLLFSSVEDILNYLLTTPEQPFIIIAEIQLRGLDGIELRRRILENDFLRNKSIPFVFFTTNKDREDVMKAYDLQIQGYFVKKFTISELQRMLHKILDYWDECVHVNNVE